MSTAGVAWGLGSGWGVAAPGAWAPSPASPAVPPAPLPVAPGWGGEAWQGQVGFGSAMALPAFLAPASASWAPVWVPVPVPVWVPVPVLAPPPPPPPPLPAPPLPPAPPAPPLPSAPGAPAGAEPPKEQAPALPKVVVVRPGDSLSRIAGRLWGDPMAWPRLFEANRDRIADPNLIFPGQRLRVPGAQGSSRPPGPRPSPAPQPAPGPKPAPGPEASAPKLGRPESYFISQYLGAWNTKEDSGNNGNCGPTSVAIIAKAFGKISPSAAGADAAIEEARRRIGESSSEHQGTSVAGLNKALASYGLNSRVRWDASIASIKEELAKGRLVIAHVRPRYLFPGTNSGHYTVVTSIEGDRVHLNDPANKRGPTTISTAQLMEAIRGRGTFALISAKG